MCVSTVPGAGDLPDRRAASEMCHCFGVHGGSEADNSAVVQFDTRSRTRKVIACLHPYFQQHAGCTLKGTYTAALDERGERLFVTWNVSRGSKAWDACALTVIHIPESERSGK